MFVKFAALKFVRKLFLQDFHTVFCLSPITIQTHGFIELPDFGSTDTSGFYCICEFFKYINVGLAIQTFNIILYKLQFTVSSGVAELR